MGHCIIQSQRQIKNPPKESIQKYIRESMRVEYIFCSIIVSNGIHTCIFHDRTNGPATCIHENLVDAHTYQLPIFVHFFIGTSKLYRSIGSYVVSVNVVAFHPSGIDYHPNASKHDVLHCGNRIARSDVNDD
jgi:hypothetical protein